MGGSGGSGMGGGGMGSSIIDGMIVKRWEEGGSWRRWGGEEERVVVKALREAGVGG